MLFMKKPDRINRAKPSKYRAFGAEIPIRFEVLTCSLGALLVAMSPDGICAIALDDDPDALAQDFQSRFPNAGRIGDDMEFYQFATKVVDLVEEPTRIVNLPLDMRGTPFQHKVWQALRVIPAGTTISYSELARRIGAPKSVRAVAGACAANSLAIAIPCHRVVRNDGILSGYRWGIERKIELLRREKKHGSDRR